MLGNSLLPTLDLLLALQDRLDMTLGWGRSG